MPVSGSFQEFTVGCKEKEFDYDCDAGYDNWKVTDGCMNGGKGVKLSFFLNLFLFFKR